MRDDMQRLADVLVAGSVVRSHLQRPFGGFRRSGSAFKEQGDEAMAFYTKVKTVAFHVPAVTGQGR